MRNIEFQSYSSSFLLRPHPLSIYSLFFSSPPHSFYVSFLFFCPTFLLRPYPFVFFLNLHRKISISKNQSNIINYNINEDLWEKNRNKTETWVKIKPKSETSSKWILIGVYLHQRFGKEDLAVPFEDVRQVCSSWSSHELGRGARLGEDTEIRKK